MIFTKPPCYPQNTSRHACKKQSLMITDVRVLQYREYGAIRYYSTYLSTLMQFDILTLFPEMFTGPLSESIIKRAIQANLISLGLHDIRDYALDKHRTTDDAP